MYRVDESKIEAMLLEESRPLDEEQLRYLEETIAWYNDKVYRDPRQVDHNPAIVISTSQGYAVQYSKSKHVRSPGAWLHYHGDMLRRALGDKEAAARVAQRRAIMNSLQS